MGEGGSLDIEVEVLHHIQRLYVLGWSRGMLSDI